METRTLLQIALGTIISAIIIIGVALVYELTRSPETKIIEKTFTEKKSAPEVEKNPWEDREEEAIALVKGTEVGEMTDETRELFELEEDESITLGELLEHEEFRSEKLKIGSAEPKGWEGDWWEETKYGDHFYLVTYVFEDAHIDIGPSWLVDLKKEKVVPKNIDAQVATEPKEAVESDYYDKAGEVVSAMTKHTFESGVTLAGTLLLYFEQRAESAEEDSILGWTIQHHRGNLFRAYFQWREGNEPAYAEFDFDYDRKALKAVNLHAGNIMRVGEEFEEKEPVDILPRSFEPEANRPEDQWTGKAAKAYAQPAHRSRFRALGTILNEADLISAIEWLLRAQAKTASEFDECKKKRKCRWKPDEKEEDVYRVTYLYNLGSGDEKIEWDVQFEGDDEESIEPVGRISKLAYRVVNPRN